MLKKLVDLTFAAWSVLLLIVYLLSLYKYYYTQLYCNCLCIKSTAYSNSFIHFI